MKWFNGREVVPAVMCLIAFGIGPVLSRFFLDWGYLVSQTSLYIETGFLALGMTLVILCGEIDLSVASTLSLVACTSAMATRAGVPPLLVLPAGVLFGAFLGSLNGVMISGLRLPSFMVSLGTMASYRGISQILMGSSSIRIPNSSPHLYLWQFGAAIIVISLLLHRTIFGRWIYAVGTNSRAAFFSGIPTGRVLIAVFAINGALAGIAGLIMNERLGVARFDHGLGLELDAITAVVLGGASILGGVGTIAGTVVALLLLGIVHTEMSIANVTAEFQLAVIGSLLVLAVLIGNVLERMLARNSGRSPKSVSAKV